MFEEIPALSMLSFFDLKSDIFFAEKLIDITAKKYLLPSTNEILAEEKFADVHIGYNNLALYFHIKVDKAFEEINSIDFRRADSVEIFIDTRDIKDKTFVSQFCHHFVFYPESINGFYGKEITRFRTEEIHPLCSPKDLKITPFLSKNNYVLDIEITSSALFSFDPTSFNRIGFTYRINRKLNPPQHFALSSSEYKIELFPALWASLELCK
jgi:Carbohydrate family 9 binding domain-like